MAISMTSTFRLSVWVMLALLAAAQGLGAPGAGSATGSAAPPATGAVLPRDTGAVPAAPVVVRFDPAVPATVVLKSEGSSMKDLPQTVLGILGWVLAALSALYTYRASKKATFQKANETEIAFHQQRLDCFLGPFRQLSRTNALLASELRSRQADPGGFRTLRVLMEPKAREELKTRTNDWQLVEEIIGIDAELDRLIKKYSGLLEINLQEYFARASAHFRVIRLAFGGKLSAESFPGKKAFDEFLACYVYPRQLDALIDLEVVLLRNRCDQLRRGLAEEHDPMPPLEIPASLELREWPRPEVRTSDAR